MKDLTKGNVNSVILKFAAPIAVGNIFQLFYSLVDTRIVGSTLGNDALAALGATTTLNTLIVGFLVGLTNGFAVIAAQRFGAGDKKGLKQTAAWAVVLGTVISVILTIASVVMLPSILGWLNMPAEHYDAGYAYIKVIMIGMTASMLYNVCASLLRAIGDTITPLVFLIFSTILNIFLDYFCILNLNMGVAGAAYATVVSQLIAFVLCAVYMIKRYETLRFGADEFRHGKGIIKNMMASGISMGLMSSLVSFGTVALQTAINTFGTNIIVAHTAARKITELFMLPFSVFGMTMTTFCGQNLGAGNYERIKQGIKSAYLMELVWCAGVVAASYTIAPVLIRAVTDTHIDEVIETAALYLKVDTTLYFVTAGITVFRNALQGMGDCITPIVSSFIELVGKVLVVVLLTPKYGYWGIIVAEPIVWVLMIIPLIVRLLWIFKNMQRAKSSRA